jgi:protein gp37
MYRVDELLKVQQYGLKTFLSIEPMLDEIMDHGLCENPIPQLYWVIIGLESLGKRAGRTVDVDHVRKIVNDCQQAEVPVWVKQLHKNGRVIKNMSDFPEDLQVRQVPEI